MIELAVPCIILGGLALGGLVSIWNEDAGAAIAILALVVAAAVEVVSNAKENQRSSQRKDGSS